jgi:hypothetical protein
MITQYILGGEMLAAEAGSATRRVKFYTGAPVLRVNGRGQLFHLSFAMTDGAADLSMLNSGRAPFVCDHVEDIDHHLGVIDRAWLEVGSAYADVRFSARDEMRPIIQDIEKGVLSNVSMSARVLERVKAPSVEKDIRHIHAVN